MGQKVKHEEEWVFSRTFLLHDIEIGRSFSTKKKPTAFASNKQNLKICDRIENL